jgi:hypothetical protein
MGESLWKGVGRWMMEGVEGRRVRGVGEGRA